VLTSKADGSYDFLGITPRLACVTVKLTGYLTKHQCALVPSNDIGYNSVALTAGVDPTDAGVADAEIVGSPDASQSSSSDAGNGLQPGPGGGCCEAGQDRPPFALVALVGWFLTRRRGTTAGA
jgi:hypothetical protein